MRGCAISKLVIDLRYATEEIERLQASVSAFVAPFGIPPNTLNHFILAIEEIVSNAMIHGGGLIDTTQATIQVVVSLQDAALCCEVIDSGAHFDPFSEVPEPDLNCALAARCLGGLGVHIVKRVADAYSYERRDNFNHTFLIKNLP